MQGWAACFVRTLRPVNGRVRSSSVGQVHCAYGRGGPGLGPANKMQHAGARGLESKSWAVRKGIWTIVLSDTFFWCVSMWDLGGTNWREDWISTLKPFALVRAFDNEYVHACVYVYSWMHVCIDLFCMRRYKYTFADIPLHLHVCADICMYMRAYVPKTTVNKCIYRTKNDHMNHMNRMNYAHIICPYMCTHVFRSVYIYIYTYKITRIYIIIILYI